jgi:lipoic acid synthetase
VDREEPDRVAQVVERLGLRYAVVTSVTRDDLPDGGASVFAATVKAIRRRVPGCEVEVLIPDFGGSRSALQLVMDTRPGVLNHNIEVVRALFSRVRPQGDYGRSLELLARAKEMGLGCGTKSGFMVGLGEDRDQVRETMHDLRDAGCDLLTIGQYLQPSPRHFPVARFYTPQEFEELRREAEAIGFVHVASGPLVRSSYRADEQRAAV